MDGELWKQVYRVVMEVGATFRSPCVQFSDATIVLAFLWASLHGRCISWGCRPLLKARSGIQRHLGSLGNFAGGLGPLPNFVRRLPRVRRWVQSKLIFNTIRIAENKGLAA